MKRTVTVLSVTALALAGLTNGITAAYAEGNTIYVKESANGDGTSAENAFGTLDAALAKATAGDIIEIVGTYTRAGGSDLNIDKAVTIQGGNLVLRLDADKKVYLSADTTFKNITLESRPESNTDFRIFANGHKLTFDGVKTVNNTSSNAPTIYSGSIKEEIGLGQESKIEFKNSPANTVVNGIYATDENPAKQANLPATFILDENVTVPQGKEINLGKNSAPIRFNTKTNNFKRFVATDAPEAHLNISVVGKVLEADLIDIPGLFVTHGKVVLGENSKVTGAVGVLTDAELDVRKPMARAGGKFSIPGNTVGQGKILIGGGNSTLVLQGKENTIDVEIQNVDKANEPVNGHTYVAYTDGRVLLTAKEKSPNCRYEFASGVATVECDEVKKDVSLSVNKLGEDDPVIVVATTEKEGEQTAAAYFENLLAELAKHPNLVVLTEGPNAPVVENDKVITVVWTAREAGSFKIKDTDGTFGQPVKFTVTTTAAGQEVSYTLPAAPEGKRYKTGAAGKAVVTGDDRFAELVFELEAIPATDEPEAGGNEGENPGGEGNQPGGENSGAQPGDTKPGDTKPGDTKPGDTKPGDTKPGAQPGDVQVQPNAPAADKAAADKAAAPVKPTLANTGAESGLLAPFAAALAIGGLALALRRRR